MGPRSEKSAWAILAGGVAVAVGSQFAWTASFLIWIGYFPFLSAPYKGPVFLGAGPERGAHLLTGYDSGHFRVVLVGCGVLLVAFAVALLLHPTNRRPFAILSLMLATGTAVYVGYELLQAWIYLKSWPIVASPAAMRFGAWITTIGSVIFVVGAVLLVRSDFSTNRSRTVHLEERTPSVSA